MPLWIGVRGTITAFELNKLDDSIRTSIRVFDNYSLCQSNEVYLCNYNEIVRWVLIV